MGGVPLSAAQLQGAEGLTDTRSAWMEHAACKGQDLSIFFVERGEKPYKALAFCDRCVVRDECLEYAQNNGEFHGIWGGKARRDRGTGLGINDKYLTPQARKRIVMHSRSGWTHREIAHEIGCTMRTVLRVLQAETTP